MQNGMDDSSVVTETTHHRPHTSLGDIVHLESNLNDTNFQETKELYRRRVH